MRSGGATRVCFTFKRLPNGRCLSEWNDQQKLFRNTSRKLWSGEVLTTDLAMEITDLRATTDLVGQQLCEYETVKLEAVAK